MSAIDLRITTGPVQWANPIFTASGTWGYGTEYFDLCDPAQLGGVVTKTLTVLPRSGNPQPRVRELRHGMLNSIGLENVGLEAFVTEKLPVLRGHGVATIVSLAAREEEEFAVMIEALQRHAGWSAVELNLSCPNVAHGGLDFGRDPQRVERITSLARRALDRDKALWVKLTPNVTAIGDLARAAEQGGADALSCINTLVGMEIDLDRRAPVFPRGTAGYSGPAILPIALAKVWEVAQVVQLPILGIGGIVGVDDILRFFVAGATGVQVGTALFARPDLALRCVDALGAALQAHGVESPGQMRSQLLPALDPRRLRNAR